MLEGLCLKKYKARIEWIDVARGICMLMILYAHAMDGGIILEFFQLFLVSVFFVLSGMVWRQAPNMKMLLLGLLKGVIIPYFIAGVVSIIIYLLAGSLFGKASISFGDCILGLFYANSRTGLMVWCRPLWFLPCLVVVRILWELISYIKKTHLQYVVVLLIWAVAIVVYYTDLREWKLPWEFEVALHALPYFVIGVMIKRHLKIPKRGDIKMWVLLCAAVVFAAICVLMLYVNGSEHSFQYIYYNIYPLYVIGALSGSGMVMAISLLIGKFKLLEMLGQNSLIILLWHKYPILLFQLTGFWKKIWSNPDSPVSILVALGVTIVSAAFSMLIGYLFTRIIGWMHRKKVE